MVEPTVAFVIGTRPEAIKVAPVVRAMADGGRCCPVLISSGQHIDPVLQALDPFGLQPDISLSLQRATGSLAELSVQLISALDTVFDNIRPDAVVVHGDTMTASVGALAAFWRKIPVVHLEAGLRTGDLAAPFPEESNRLIIDHLASLMLAPTPETAANLSREGLDPDRVVITGNTVVDAIQHVAARSLPYSDARLAGLEEGSRRVVLVTVHRRESWGEPIRNVLRAIRVLIDEHPDIQVVLPAHPNPAVRSEVEACLADVERVLVCDPLPYADMARLLAHSTLVLSDSGGIQEEAPSFGVPVLVLRDVTERQEAIAAGCAWLVGTDPERIVRSARSLLTPKVDEDRRIPANPFGDGRAAPRAVDAIAWLLGVGDRPESFAPVTGAGSLQPV